MLESINISSLVFALIYFFLAQRMLDRFHLTDAAAVGVLLVIFGGTLINIPITATVSINLGGLAAIVLAAYVLIRADTSRERARAVFGGAITAVILYVYPQVAKVPEPGLDLLYWQGPVAGAIAYVMGRSRRAAFIGGVLAILILDIAGLGTAYRQGVLTGTVIAGGGAFDAVVLAGITAAVLAEVVGELTERLVRGSGGDRR